MARARLGLAVLAAAALITAAAEAPASARDLRLGVADRIFMTPDSGDRRHWLDRMKATGAKLVEIAVDWSLIAPADPTAGFTPRDPADPAYNWAQLDAAIRDAAARHLAVVLVPAGAPGWAEGAHRPGDAPPGTWRPNARAFGAFGHALAARYSGSFADPLSGSQSLPRVRYFRVWNEPNLRTYLNPQWSGTRPRSPGIYLRLLNAFYAAVHGVRSTNRVLAPGLAPFGDPPGENRMRPITFLRRLFCLGGDSTKRGGGCRARLDIVAHHPISAERPRRHAISPNDVTTPDLGRIKRVLREARRGGRLFPAGPKPLWVTEFWWVSRPPQSFGVRERKHARWLAEALYLFWKQGAGAALWFQIVDPPASCEGCVATGLHFSDGNPKTAFRAFRFPFVVDPRRGSGDRSLVWGRAPVPGRVRIQLERGGNWRTIRTVANGRGGVFTARLEVPREAKLRAKLGSGEVSLPWRTG